MPYTRILKADSIGDYKVRLEYETGETRLFDMLPYISGNWYGELHDLDYFASVRPTDDGLGIEWANGQDIAPHELHELGYEISETAKPICCHENPVSLSHRKA